MTQTFTTSTQDDVVRYLYNETTALENASIEDSLLYDKDMLDFYLDLVELKLSLDNAIVSPPDRAIDRILDYSRNYQPKA
jgi:hypothetical protein